jgi:hypothetical protein
MRKPLVFFAAKLKKGYLWLRKSKEKQSEKLLDET